MVLSSIQLNVHSRVRTYRPARAAGSEPLVSLSTHPPRSRRTRRADQVHRPASRACTAYVGIPRTPNRRYLLNPPPPRAQHRVPYVRALRFLVRPGWGHRSTRCPRRARMHVERAHPPGPWTEARPRATPAQPKVEPRLWNSPSPSCIALRLAHQSAHPSPAAILTYRQTSRINVDAF